VGRKIPDPAEEDAQSEVSEWELRERQERVEERRQEAEEMGGSAFCGTGGRSEGEEE